MKHARSPFRFPIWGFFAVILLIISIVLIIKISSKKNEGFAGLKTCYAFYTKTGDTCGTLQKFAYTVPTNGYKDSRCATKGGVAGAPASKCY